MCPLVGRLALSMASSRKVIPIAPVSGASDDGEQFVSTYQKQATIYPRAVKGWFATWRWVFVWLTQLLFYGLPWLQWGGRQAVLFDLDAQRFYIFGLLLHLQDLIFLAALQVRCGQGPRRVGSCGRGRRGRECLPHPDHEPHRVCANLPGGRCRHRGFGGLGQNCQCRPGQCGVDVGEPALALGRSARACRPVGPIVFEVRGWEHRAGADTASTKQFKKSAFFVPR